MPDKTNRKTLRNLILEFLDFEIPADRFVSRFTKSWKKERDAQWLIKSSWDEPLDEQLQGEFLGKKLSREEFSRRWNELWGYSETDAKFHDMTDTIFSACAGFRSDPDSDPGSEAEGLRTSVAEAFLSYLRSVTEKQGAGSR